MSKATSKNSYASKACDRCGSKRRISKTWKETVATLTGSTVIEYSQIICTNTVCQAAFEVNLAKETKKRQSLQKEKEKRYEESKKNALKRKKTLKKKK